MQLDEVMIASTLGSNLSKMRGEWKKTSEKKSGKDTGEGF